jgi:hypothetical protein
VIRLATHFAVGSGREGVIRLTLTAVGIALATVMLLCAAVAYPALHAHEIRRGWMDTSAHNRQPAQDETTTDPLLWRMIETRFDGRDLVRVDVAAEGPDAPVPPGLDALPADGSLAAPTRPGWPTGSPAWSPPLWAVRPWPPPMTWWCSSAARPTIFAPSRV